MGVQDLTVQMVVIVVIGVFFASFMDAIAGGGGIISVPTYLLAGLPMHFALGTNKFSSSIGTAFSTGRYIKNGYVDWKLGIPSIVLALIGSFFGTKLQLMISEVYLQYLLLIVLPVVAFVVLRQRQLPEERGDIKPKKQMAIVYLAALTSIDPSLYEAATVDGASKWKKLLHITLPCILPTIMTMLILRMGSIFTVGYEKIMLMYNPATYETADVISTYVYRRAFEGGEYSFSAAVGLFNSVINFIVIIVFNKISKRVSEVSLW